MLPLPLLNSSKAEGAQIKNGDKIRFLTPKSDIRKEVSLARKRFFTTNPTASGLTNGQKSFNILVSTQNINFWI